MTGLKEFASASDQVLHAVEVAMVLSGSVVDTVFGETLG